MHLAAKLFRDAKLGGYSLHSYQAIYIWLQQTEDIETAKSSIIIGLEVGINKTEGS